MPEDSLLRKWHEVIIKDAEAKLQRPLKDYERLFIESRGGYIALELIHDTVKASDVRRLEEYLGSERPGKKS